MLRSLVDWFRGHSPVALVLSFIAILIALGGVSYAATQLPRHSVGPAQIKPKAVGPKALAFPLGIAGASRENLGPVVSTGFCVPVNGIAPPCAPPIPNDRFSLKVKARRAGLLHVTGNVNLLGTGDDDRPNGSAVATVGIQVDGVEIAPTTSSGLELHQNLVVPFEGLTRVKAGTHEVRLILGGTGFNLVNVQANSAVMTATVLPGAGSR